MFCFSIGFVLFSYSKTVFFREKESVKVSLGSIVETKNWNFSSFFNVQNFCSEKMKIKRKLRRPTNLFTLETQDIDRHFEFTSTTISRQQNFSSIFSEIFAKNWIFFSKNIFRVENRSIRTGGAIFSYKFSSNRTNDRNPSIRKNFFPKKKRKDEFFFRRNQTDDSGSHLISGSSLASLIHR